MKNYSEIEKSFSKVGVDLKDKNGNCKSLYDIFGEIAEKWHKLNLNDYVEFYKESTNIRIYDTTGKIYPAKYEWGKSEFWIDETTKILSVRGLSLKQFDGIDRVDIGDSSYPYTIIRFKNGVEIYAEGQSPSWAIEENDKILNRYQR